MLRELGIRHFVLIDELRLSFEPGLNVLTGETGAGKSIVLDALALLSGGRFDAGSVRQGAERASVDALFDVPSSAAFRRWWTDHGWAAPEELLLRREGTPDGKSKAYLNDRPVTAATLAELGEFLLDIHGQHDHLSVLRADMQRDLLDRFGDLDAETEALAPLFRQWQTLEAEWNQAQLSEDERLTRLDLLRFQYDEIVKAAVKPGEDEALESRLPELKHGEKMRQSAAQAQAALSGEDSAGERLAPAHKALETLAGFTPQAAAWRERLRQTAADLDDLAQELSAWMDRLGDADPGELETLLNRLDALSRLKKKYGGTLESVLARADSLRAEIDALENADLRRAELGQKKDQALATLNAACAALSRKRTTAARELSAAVQKELGDLGLRQAAFQCGVRPLGKPSATGGDLVEFVWAPNPGEGMRPLKEIASGGEMSRVMLAIKTVLAGADDVPVLIFDEVDAGIGGQTAQAVGKKLRALGRQHQVLCVSHLPQIASAARAHFHVSKRSQRNRTFAVVERLDGQARLEEVARLLAGTITPVSLEHARELLGDEKGA